MPLRKPLNLPKVTKSRTKKAHAALNAIPLKKPDKIDYKCRAYFKYDEPTRKQYHAFSIETVVEFRAFAYEISVKQIKEKNVFYFVLAGLKAKTDRVPENSPARTEILLEDLFGEFTFNVVKQDGAINSAVMKFNIYNREILLLKEFVPKKKNNRLFCKFEVAPGEFSFAESLI